MLHGLLRELAITLVLALGHGRRHIAGIVQIEAARQRHRRQEGVYFLLGGDVYRFHEMTDKVGLQDHHYRQVNFFGQFEGLDDAVGRLLVVLAVNLHPARVPLGEGIGLIGPECPGSGKRAIDRRHHHGGAAA